MTDYIALFGRYMEAERRCSASTVDIYTRDLRGFENYMKESDGTEGDFLDPSVVAQEDVRAWVMREVEAGIAVGSVNRKITTIRSFFRYMMRLGEVEGEQQQVIHNPALKIKALRKGRQLPHFVEQNRMSQLIKVLEEPSEEFAIERDAMVILLLYACGLRRSELSGLTISSLNTHERTIRVVGKGSKERMLPLLPEVARRLKHYLQVRERKNVCITDKDCLFLSNKGRGLTPSGVYAIVRGYLSMAGVQGKCSTHVLRHTFATHLMQRGVSVRVVQQFLGHASLASTQIYTHNTIESLKESYNNAHPRAILTKKTKTV